VVSRGLNSRISSLKNIAGILQNDRQIIQQKRKLLEGNNDQKWFYREDGYLYPRNDPNLVLDIRVCAISTRNGSLREEVD
jgi:hypothetical protein